MDASREQLQHVAMAVAVLMVALMILKRWARRRGLATLGQRPARRGAERRWARFVDAPEPPSEPKDPNP